MPTDDAVQGISQSAMRSSGRREKGRGNNNMGKFKVGLMVCAGVNVLVSPRTISDRALVVVFEKDYKHMTRVVSNSVFVSLKSTKSI